MAAASAAPDSVGDELNLAKNAEINKMLAKHGVNKPDVEEVKLSIELIKINKREKSQTRVLMVTQKAIYNLIPGSYSKFKRRIALDVLGGITSSSLTDQFVLHVPDEYDYRYSSKRKAQIAKAVGAIYSDYMAKQVAAGGKRQPKLAIVSVDMPDLKDKAMTKAQARLQTREGILKRKREIAAACADDQEELKEEQNEEGASESILPGQAEKVSMKDFELLKVLGRGSFGKVMQVKKISDGMVYAMKILKKRAIIARNQVEHTKAERKILESLQHPFLMQLRYAFQTAEKLYFVLDYYQGGELFFHLKNRRKFSEETARIYVGEIALALGHLHSLGVIYRDLKPENILLDENGHVCLTDFGLSKDVDPSDKSHTFCGTPEYLAPEIVTEVVTGAGHDKAVDWWSLGILLYELTVGIPPFYSQNVNDMYNKIQHGALRFPPYLSADCKALIVQLLNRDPKKRLGSVNDVEDIKKQPFFASINWDKMMKKQIHPPYKPKVKSGVMDTENFDRTFTQEVVVDTPVGQSALGDVAVNEAFDQFTFNAQSSHLDSASAGGRDKFADFDD